MEAVGFIYLLQFAENKYTQPLSVEILEALGGKAPEKKKPSPLTGEGMELKILKEKVFVNWTDKLCIVREEELSNQERSMSSIISYLDKIDGIAPIYKTNLRRLTINWILPAPKHDFLSLERLYRKTMIVKNGVSDLAFDSSVIFDIKNDGLNLHHQSGAMGQQQLVQYYLKFPKEELPKNFIFLETSIVDQNVIEYSGRETEKFLKNSLAHCVSHSQLFEKVWEGSL